MARKASRNVEKDSKNAGSSQLDGKDRKILSILFNDARKSIADISRETGIKRDSVAYRIQKMQENGLLRFNAYIDMKQLGFAAASILILNLQNFSAEKEKQLREFLKSSGEAVEVKFLSGSSDYMVKIIAQNQDELNLFIRKLRTGFAGIIKEMELSNVVEEIYKMPLP
ncbi:AsnC family transcriptional regulator [Candidatus Woesearchaeota archaeon]|nr:AsnC family transcriptional regulator [Candidatus Woesearchaeota archaeon]